MTSFLISIQTLIGSDGSLVFRGSFPGGTSILVSLRQYSLLAVDSSRRVPRLSNVQDVFQKQRKSTSRSLCRCCRRLKWTRTSNEQDDETQLSVCCVTFGVDKNRNKRKETAHQSQEDSIFLTRSHLCEQPRLSHGDFSTEIFSTEGEGQIEVRAKQCWFAS